MTEIPFATWLQNQLDARGWRQADLVRASGIHSGYLSKLLNRERMPGVETCQAIAKAFNMRDTDVMKIAGLAANTSPDDQTPSLRELISKFTQLSNERQESILDMVRALDEMEQSEKRRAGRLKPHTKTG
jgi:transcriptional regulator with XRE-family HTH domain